MNDALMILLVIMTMAIIWSTMLQTIRFFMDIGREQTLDAKEIDISDKIREFYQEKEDFEHRRKGWKDFGTECNFKGNPIHQRGPDFFTHEFIEPEIEIDSNQPIRNEDGKFNPDEIEGALDGLFDK